MSKSTIKPNSVAAWVLAARPATLTAAFVPVAVGSACAFAAGMFSPVPALAALLGAFLIQIGTNFANDVFDFEKGADTEARLGPVRAVQAGLISPASLRKGMCFSFALAIAIGVYLTWVAGPVVVAIGLASVAAGIGYTGGPFPLAYNGLGDIFVLIFFGFVAVCGTVFVQGLTVPEVAWWASLPVGALATAILVVNNVRDEEGDRLANKRTLIVRFGRAFGLTEYATLMLLAFATPAGLFVTDRASAFVLLPLVLLPIAWRLFSSLRRDSGAALNATLVGTARLLFVFGVLFSLGLGIPV